MSKPCPDEIPETILVSCEPLSPGGAPVLKQAPPAASVQRRARVRWRCGLKAFCQLGSGRDDAGWWQANVEEVSAVGLRLVLPQDVQPNSVLVIEPRTNGRTTPLRLVARVVHSTPASEGTWALGCQLSTPLSDSQLRTLLF
jgi:hypothetical protein